MLAWESHRDRDCGLTYPRRPVHETFFANTRHSPLPTYTMYVFLWLLLLSRHVTYLLELRPRRIFLSCPSTSGPSRAIFHISTHLSRNQGLVPTSHCWNTLLPLPMRLCLLPLCFIQKHMSPNSRPTSLSSYETYSTTFSTSIVAIDDRFLTWPFHTLNFQLWLY